MAAESDVVDIPGTLVAEMTGVLLLKALINFDADVLGRPALTADSETSVR